MLRQTNLRLPNNPDSCDPNHEQDDDDSSSSHFLTVPVSTNSIDTYIATTIPEIVTNNNRLLSKHKQKQQDNSINNNGHYQPIELNQHTKQRIIYAGQREMAHVAQRIRCSSTSSNDTNNETIVVSDRATTCHVVIFRSTSSSTSRASAHISNKVAASEDTNVALCTVTHLDDTCYDDCIRKAILYHQKFHFNQQQKQRRLRSSDPTTTLTESCNDKNCSSPETIIEMDIHVVGGYEDEKGSSRELSNWLLYLLIDIASEVRFYNFHMTLQTALITCMNNTTTTTNTTTNTQRQHRFGFRTTNRIDNNYPIGRGLAMNCQTGNVFLPYCTHDVMGPELFLRSARLWSSNNNNHPTLFELCKASLDHNNYNTDDDNDHICIKPFAYYPTRYLQSLSRIENDDELLQLASTSPNCEGDDFCYMIRQTIHYISTVPYEQVFRNGKCLVFERKCRRHNTNTNNVNEWIPITE